MLARISLRYQLQQMGVISELERVEDYTTFESTFKNGLYNNLYIVLPNMVLYDNVDICGYCYYMACVDILLYIVWVNILYIIVYSVGGHIVY